MRARILCILVSHCIPGCEDYYNPQAKKKKAELASSLGASADSDDFNKFIKLLKDSGVLGGKGGSPFKSPEKSVGLAGLKAGLLDGGPRRGRPEGRPRRPEGRPRGQGIRPGGRGRPRRPGNRRPRPQRPRFPEYEYDDYDYEVSPLETPAESRAFNQNRPKATSVQVIIGAHLS